MDRMQYETGQNIVYGSNGICVVDDIRRMKITSDSPLEPYYVLKLKRDMKTTIFVPANNMELTAKMRAPMKKDEIISMLEEPEEYRVAWIADRRNREELFHEILREGTSRDLLHMVICLYKRKEELFREGKRLSETDTKTLKTATGLLEEEVAFVLEISSDDVAGYIMQKLGVTDRE